MSIYMRFRLKNNCGYKPILHCNFYIKLNKFYWQYRWLFSFLKILWTILLSRLNLQKLAGNVLPTIHRLWFSTLVLHGITLNTHDHYLLVFSCVS